MDTISIVKKFVEYADYQPERGSFILGSSTHQLHTICKNLNSFLEFDPSGTLAVIYLRKAYEVFLSHMQLDVVQLFKNPNILDDEKTLWNMLNSLEVNTIEQDMVNIINSIVVRLNGGRLLGERNIAKEIEVLEEVLPGAVTDLHSCHKEVYLRGGPLQPITHLNSHITVFNTLADCLLTLENCPRDGIYLCYINYNKSADGFFGFFIKNNGNIFSIHDRVLERYPGQHAVSRNARWTSEKKTNLFPYDYIFNYTDHDYKGYATTFDIQDDMLDFFKLQAEVYMPIVVAMSVLSRVYSSGDTNDMPQVYCNSMFQENLPALESTHLPAVIASSALAKVNKSINITLESDKVKNGEYADEFRNTEHYFEYGCFPEENNIFAQLYGEGFQLGETLIANNVTESGLVIHDRNAAAKNEFVTTEKHMKLVAYKKAREQLAEYIRDQMCEELRRAGGYNGIYQWYQAQIKDNKDKIFYLMAKVYAKAELTEEEKEFAEHINIYKTDALGANACPLNPVVSDGRFYSLQCPINRKAPSIEIKWVPENWKDIEKMFGSVPKILKGWERTSCRGTGNPLLSVVDEVSFVGTPFEDREIQQNKRLWDDDKWASSIWQASYDDREEMEKEKEKYAHYEHCRPMNFSVAVKFSKSGLREYCKQQGIKIKRDKDDFDTKWS